MHMLETPDQFAQREARYKQTSTALDTKTLTPDQVVEAKDNAVKAGVRTAANLLVSATLFVSPTFTKDLVVFAGQRIFERLNIEPFPVVERLKFTGGNFVRPILSLLGFEGLFYSLDSLHQLVRADLGTMVLGVRTAIAKKRGEVPDFAQNTAPITQAARAFGQNIGRPAPAMA